MDETLSKMFAMVENGGVETGMRSIGAFFGEILPEQGLRERRGRSVNRDKLAQAITRQIMLRLTSKSVYPPIYPP